MDFQPGDIILYKQKPYNWFRWSYTTIAQVFRFFFLKIGLIEAVDRFYHIVMFYGVKRAQTVFTEEPPRARVENLPRKTKFRVFRLKNIPNNFYDLFFSYCLDRYYLPFDYAKFWQLVLDAIFHTQWFSGGKSMPKGDVCAESVSRFYKEILGIPCSTKDPESSIPSDVNRYCCDHPEIFEMVRDDE